MDDDALTGQEKALAFAQSTMGMVAIGGIAVLLIVSMLWGVGLLNMGSTSSGNPFAAGEKGEGVVAQSATNAYEQAWREKMESESNAREQQLADLQNGIAQSDAAQKAALAATLKKMEADRKRLLEEMARIQAARPNTVIVQQAKDPYSNNMDNLLAEDAQVAEGGIQAGDWKTIKVGGSKSDIRIKAPVIRQKAKPKEIKVPMGSFARVRLLTGVNAPTKGTPWPTLMVLQGPIQGPNGQSYPAEGCFALGDALGHIGTTQDKILPNGQEAEVGRVEIKMTGISCDWGTVGFDQDMVGYVVDKDKQFGIEGIVHNRLPKEILMQMEAAGLGGLGEGLTAASTVTSTVANAATTQTFTQRTGGLLLPAAGAALQAGTDNLKTYLTEKAKESVTTIEIPGGIDVDFFIVKSFTMLDQTSIGREGKYGSNGLY